MYVVFCFSICCSAFSFTDSVSDVLNIVISSTTAGVPVYDTHSSTSPSEIIYLFSAISDETSVSCSANLPSLDNADGIKLFAVGLAKKVLIANQMGVLWDTIRGTSSNGIVGAWIGIISYAFQIYFDFSGYSDMACGLGKMFGFEFMKNFNYPYVSKTITEFWRRWHISLSSWFRDYVYIPLGGNRCKLPRVIFNLFAVWALTGLWHGANFNFIAWGIYYFVILVLEKYVYGKYLEKLPSLPKHIYALFLILLGWTIFYFEDFGQFATYLTSMFTLKNGIIGGDTLSTILMYLPILIVTAMASLPIWKNTYLKLKDKKYMGVLEIAFCAVVIVLCTASLVNQSYNPFLYFRF